MYNALDPENAAPQSGPLAPKKKPLDQAKPKAVPETGFNARPDANANSGAAPALMGDKQKIAKPPVPRIASSASAPVAAAGPIAGSSGIDTAMSAMADSLHPRKRR